MANAIIDAMQTHLADAIHISLGGPGWFPLPKSLGKAVDFECRRGVIIDAAAGPVTDRVA